jgi:hypothetical protein
MATHNTNHRQVGRSLRIASNLRRISSTTLGMFLIAATAWAGNHQICYQIPPLAGFTTVAARFACRTDGANSPGCQITAVQAVNSGASVTSFYGLNQNASSAESEAIFNGPGVYVGNISFSDGTARTCTVEVPASAYLKANSGSQLRTLLGFNTDESGLVMTGVWQSTSAAADQAFVEVVVPPDFVAVGGGAEGTESPFGTLVNESLHYNYMPQSWLAAAHGNVPPGVAQQISPVIGWGIGLKIEGVDRTTLQQIVQFPGAGSYSISGSSFESNPTSTYTTNMFGGVDKLLYPQTLAAISGGIDAEHGSTPNDQYATETRPVFFNQCFTSGACERVVRGWTATSKDHVNSSPWWVFAQMTTLPKELTINGTLFHVETQVASAISAPAAHPSVSAALPAGYALTGIGAFVDWQHPPAGFVGAGNLLFRLKPRPDINGVEAASKDQWIPSPAAITGYAIGMKLVPGGLPPLLVRVFTCKFGC